MFYLEAGFLFFQQSLDFDATSRFFLALET